jgi:signal transduction histidine kinase
MSRSPGQEGPRRAGEGQIESLHAATRRLIDVRGRDEIACVAVDAATDVLDFPFSVVWFTTPEETLRAAAVSDGIRDHLPDDVDDPGEAMAFERGSWLWDLYDADTAQRVTVDGDQPASNAPLHTGVAVPLDGYGLLTVGTRDDANLSERDVKLASILGENAQAALSRAERERRIQEQRDDLELLNRIVRHDIRNDLQLVDAYADLLGDFVEGETAEEYLRKIRENAESAVGLTETARDLAETMLQSESDLEPVALRSTLDTQVEEVQSTHGRADVAVDGSIPAVRVRADGMLSSVFRNVLTNAVQHNDSAEPTVRVSATERDARVVVRVADDGPGVPDDRKAEIFGKGERGLDSQGTGIGLYLVHTLVDRYGGEVWVEDSDLGGAVFCVELRTA